MFTLSVIVMFGQATNIVKNNDKQKYVHSGYGKTIDSAGSWSVDNDFARNVIISGVGNSSSSHTDNCKNYFLILDESSTYGINGSFGLSEKKVSINFNKASTKFWLSLHYNADNIFFFLMEKKSLTLKLTTRMLTFQLNFVSKLFLMDLLILSLEKYL